MGGGLSDDCGKNMGLQVPFRIVVIWKLYDFFGTESGAKLLKFLENVVKIQEINDDQHVYRVSIGRNRIDPKKMS